MKFGVPVFSYSNIPIFQRRLRRQGAISINLGDYMQTIAVRRLLEELGAPAEDVVNVDRDTLRDYAGEPVAFVMNGCFYEHCFPLPETVRPIFIGFQAAREVLEAQRDWLKLHQPIGCRDAATAHRLQRLGVEAYVSGCFTLTLPTREQTPETGKVFMVYGERFGQMPPDLVKHVPDDLLDASEFIFQRKVVHEMPLSRRGMADAERHARFLLNRYRDEASLVITPLHHAATPAMALGVPVVLARAADDARFSFLHTFSKVYFPEEFGSIDWRAQPVDVEAHRARLKDLLRRAVETISAAA